MTSCQMLRILSTSSIGLLQSIFLTVAAYHMKLCILLFSPQLPLCNSLLTYWPVPPVFLLLVACACDLPSRPHTHPFLCLSGGHHSFPKPYSMEHCLPRSPTRSRCSAGVRWGGGGVGGGRGDPYFLLTVRALMLPHSQLSQLSSL